MTEAVESQVASLSLDEVHQRFGVEFEVGLSEQAVADRQGEHGENRLTDDDGVGVIELLCEEVLTAVSALLLLAAVAAAAIGEWVEATAVLVALGVNVVVGFITKLRAHKSMDALAELLQPTAEVVRDGERRKIDAAGLVLGDVVVLDEGDRVAADLRLVEAEDLRVDESSLTGESEPVTKHTNAVQADTALADRGCVAFTSTTVVFGSGSWRRRRHRRSDRDRTGC